MKHKAKQLSSILLALAMAALTLLMPLGASAANSGGYYSSDGRDYYGFEASGNNIIIDSDILHQLYAGKDAYNDVTENSVIINSGVIGDSVDGGMTIYGTSSGNSVTINGGSIGGHVFGGYSTYVSASGNTVIMTGGSVGMRVYGGYSGYGAASNNVVRLSGGSVSDVIGGHNFATNDEYGPKDASGNTIEIAGNVTGLERIAGGLVHGGNATNNTIILHASASGASVFGGDMSPFSIGRNPESDYVTGNTLLIKNKGIEVKSAQNFENITFTLDSCAAGDTLLTTTETIDLSGMKIALDYGSGAFSPKSGDAIVLASNVKGNPKNGVFVHSSADDSADCLFELSVQAGKLIATVAASITEQPKDIELVQGYKNDNVISLVIDAKNDRTLGYQWYEGGTEAKPVESATNASFPVPEGLKEGETKDYFCVITDSKTGEKLVSKTATVTVNKAPAFIPGDVNGNGRIDPNDYALAKRAFLGTYELDSEELMRADIDGSGKLDSNEYAMIKRHCLGTYTIPGAEGK